MSEDYTDDLLEEIMRLREKVARLEARLKTMRRKRTYQKIAYMKLLAAQEKEI